MVHVFVYVCLYVCVYVCIYICICTCTHTHIHEQVNGVVPGSHELIVEDGEYALFRVVLVQSSFVQLSLA